MLYTISKNALILVVTILVPLLFTVHENKVLAQGERIVFPGGAEVGAGSFDGNSGKVYGSTITLNSADNNGTQHLTVSFDYEFSDVTARSFGVVSGSWTLVTFMDGNYAGTIYGRVTGGKVTPSDEFAPPNEPPSGPRSLNISLVTSGTIAALRGPFDTAVLDARSDGHTVTGTLITPF
ncbi:MAG TPA: hypothetical protein VJL58_04250 [Pyrinomonadaceae bacterium]|nr:hypothetical protein [Pyrinomonadaceae bacterium]